VISHHTHRFFPHSRGRDYTGCGSLGVILEFYHNYPFLAVTDLWLKFSAQLNGWLGGRAVLRALNFI